MLLNVQEAARLLAVRPERIYVMAREGVIPCVRIGEKTIRFSDAALKQFIERGGLTQTNGNGSEGGNGKQAAA